MWEIQIQVSFPGSEWGLEPESPTDRWMLLLLTIELRMQSLISQDVWEFLFLFCIVLKTHFKHWNYFALNGVALFQPALIPYMANLARGLRSRLLPWLWKWTSGGRAIIEPLYVRRMYFGLCGWVCKQEQSPLAYCTWALVRPNAKCSWSRSCPQST